MRQRKTVLFLLMTLILSAFACNLPQPGSAPALAPTDSGFQVPTQPGIQETRLPSSVPGIQTTPQSPDAGVVKPENNKLALGTTSILVGSGLIDQLLGPFQAISGYEVEVEKGGAGRALKLGENTGCRRFARE